MRHRKTLAVACVLALASVFSGQLPARVQAAGESTLAMDYLTFDPVEGQSVGAWTAQWWRWAFNQPIAPYLDPDGRLCELGQAGPVWFLAGTNGRFRPKRTCVIPEGKYLLVPVINMIYMHPPSNTSTSTCEDLQSNVAITNDNLRSAVALLDGEPLGDVQLRRVRSEGCFHLDAGDPTSQLAAADGFWLMIKPLPRGRHTLVIGANYGAPGTAYGDMNQNFEYVLDVGGKALLGRSDVENYRWLTFLSPLAGD
jgi:hypothetical protein